MTVEGGGGGGVLNLNEVHRARRVSDGFVGEFNSFIAAALVPLRAAPIMWLGG